MMPAPGIVVQTVYAELLERCTAAAFAETFSADGSFISKTVRGRRYWYFQETASEGRTQKYVGPESPELLERITVHRQARGDQKERRALVSTLVRSFGLPRPTPPEIGDILAALTSGGIFRLRAVLIGTIAYQTYSAMLGVKLPGATLQTGDIDIAQFENVSIAIGDSTRPVLEILKQADTTFRAIPNARDGRRTTAYMAKGGLRVEFLTPNEGSDTNKLKALPALHTDAEPLRFLDFLIHDFEQAVVLHDAGLLVNVPAPERYAVHKLIVSQRRASGSAKREKDIRQAQVLFGVLTRSRPEEVKSVWNEAFARGPTWQELLLKGLNQLALTNRDAVLKAIGQLRSVLPGVDLKFGNVRPQYDFDRDVAIFIGDGSGGVVRCEISREALDDYFDANGLTKEERLAKYHDNRSEIEGMARVKYLHWPVEEPGVTLIRTEDVPKLRKQMGRRR